MSKRCSRCYARRNNEGKCPFKCEDFAKPAVRARQLAAKQRRREQQEKREWRGCAVRDYKKKTVDNQGTRR